jgi:FkbM family methyltransferase
MKRVVPRDGTSLRTAYLKMFPEGGSTALFSLYTKILTRGTSYRIDDFDGDLMLDINPAESMGFNLWHAPGEVEPSERRLLCDAVTPGCTVLDIGANLGIYTLLAAKRGARVFAVEADLENAKRLRHHISLNGFTQSVVTFNVAASDHSHRVGLKRNTTNCGASSVVPGDSVQAVTIDSLGLPPIDVCKMDIEGAEVAALNGMMETIRRSPQMKMLIEYNVCSDQPLLLATLRRTFSHISIVGGPELTADERPPAVCNLWCWS